MFTFDSFPPVFPFLSAVTKEVEYYLTSAENSEDIAEVSVVKSTNNRRIMVHIPHYTRAVCKFFRRLPNVWVTKAASAAASVLVFPKLLLLLAGMFALIQAASLNWNRLRSLFTAAGSLSIAPRCSRLLPRVPAFRFNCHKVRGYLVLYQISPSCTGHLQLNVGNSGSLHDRDGGERVMRTKREYAISACHDDGDDDAATIEIRKRLSSVRLFNM